MKNKNLKGDKSEWWVMDGEHIHLEMREQSMHHTRLVLKEQELEPFCKRYMELYQELRENWDEGYSKKLAQDHADYESGDENDHDFSPYRRQRSNHQIKDQGFGAGRQGDYTWQKTGQIRDKFEYDRERKMRDKVDQFPDIISRLAIEH